MEHLFQAKPIPYQLIREQQCHLWGANGCRTPCGGSWLLVAQRSGFVLVFLKKIPCLEAGLVLKERDPRIMFDCWRGIREKSVR